MRIFWSLLLAHMLADFVLHGNRTFDLKKNTKFLGLFLHGFVYFICLLVLCWPFLNMHWFNIGPLVFSGWGSIALLVFLHILSDRIDKSDVMFVEGRNSILFLLWQAVEILVLFVVFPVLPSNSGVQDYLFGEKTLIILSGTIFATYFMMVFIHLFKRDFFKMTYPSFDEKYVSMLYRLSLYLLLLLPSYTGYLCAFIWVMMYMYINRTKCLDGCIIRVSIGTLSALVLGIITRIFIY